MIDEIEVLRRKLDAVSLDPMGAKVTVGREPTGQWHTYRPDGTEID